MTPPTLAKVFKPTTIISGASSILTLILHNPNNTVATLVSPLTDHVPANLVVSPAATTTCGGVVNVSNSIVTLTGGSILPNDDCTVAVEVAGQIKGQYLNTIPAGALQTSLGNSLNPAQATLTIN